MKYYQNKPIKSWEVEDQPREKMANKGVGSLTDAELMAILLSTGTREHSAIDLGRMLIDGMGSLDLLARASMEDLMKIKGIGRAKATLLMAAFELGRRKLFSQQQRAQIKSSRDAFNYLQPLMTDLRQEHFYLLFLNHGNDVIGHKHLSTGGTSSTIVDTKLVFKEAVDKLASGIIIAHNHPSGNTSPSQADEKITERIFKAGSIMDIRVMDHLIISHRGYYSFADAGKLSEEYFKE